MANEKEPTLQDYKMAMECIFYKLVNVYEEVIECGDYESYMYSYGLHLKETKKPYLKEWEWNLIKTHMNFQKSRELEPQRWEDD